VIALARIGVGRSAPLATGTYTFFDVNSGGVPPIDLASQTSSIVAVGSALKSGGAAGAGQGCTVVEGAKVTGGTVTLSSVTATALAGTVDLTLSNGGAIKGSFNAPLCTTSANIDATCNVTGIPTGANGSCM
jgi:hypothetical protein